jgi:F-type H+-transporting ATPase subunit gamma
MSERLTDVSRRIGTVRQLDAVVNAMRGIAASRAQQGRALLPAIRAYADVAARALGQALLLFNDGNGVPLAPPTARALGAGVILFGAEQGFAGAFTDQVLDAAAPALADNHVFVVGSRAAALAAERGLTIDRAFAEPLRATALPGVAALLADAIYDYLRMSGATRIEMIYPVWTPGQGLNVKRRGLLPLDQSVFAAASATESPLIQMPLASLLDRLSEEYVFALLCEAATESFAAENEARVATMAAAGSNIEAKLAGLQSLERLTRQEDVTSEMVELASGARSRRSRNRE